MGLPYEMHKRIKAHIHSLEDHVNFSLTCLTTKALYDDDFWKFACMSAGWGMLDLSGKTKAAIAAHQAKGNAVQIWAGLARVLTEDARNFKDYACDELRDWIGSESEYTKLA